MNLARLKRLWKLTQKDPEAIKKLESLTEEEMAFIPNANDVKAEFFGEGTEKEFKDFQKEEQGMKPWYERLKDL